MRNAVELFLTDAPADPPLFSAVNVRMGRVKVVTHNGNRVEVRGELTVWTAVVTLVDDLCRVRSDTDANGDLSEHLLLQIKQGGEPGPCRTPRHLVRGIVENGARSWARPTVTPPPERWAS